MIEFLKTYKFAHLGIRVVEYLPGQVVEADDELAECAVKRDRVAKLVKTKAHIAAPENKAFVGSPETR